MAGRPLPKRRFKVGETFDPQVHLDLRVHKRRQKQIGQIVGGDIIVTKQEFDNMKVKPKIFWPLPGGKIGFLNHRRYPIRSAGRRREDHKDRTNYDHD